MFRKLKSLIKRIDDLFFKSQIQNYLYQRKVSLSLVNLINYNNAHLSTTYFSKDITNILSDLCDKYGSDKGELNNSGQPYLWPAHSYTEYYGRIFSHCRLKIKKVFECGIGSPNPKIPCTMGEKGRPGASLRVWRDYFPYANVYGADIDENILFNEERIKTFYLNQLDPLSIKNFWDNVGEQDFDFIVDDGLHTFIAGITLFKNSISKLSQEGIYVIEDVNIDDLLLYRNFFDNQKFNVDYVVLKQPKLQQEFLVVIRKKQAL